VLVEVILRRCVFVVVVVVVKILSVNVLNVRKQVAARILLESVSKGVAN